MLLLRFDKLFHRIFFPLLEGVVLLLAEIWISTRASKKVTLLIRQEAEAGGVEAGGVGRSMLLTGNQAGIFPLFGAALPSLCRPRGCGVRSRRGGQGSAALCGRL